MSILLLTIGEGQLSSSQVEAIQATMPSYLQFVHTRDREVMKPLLPEVEVAVGWIEPKWILEMPNLRWLQQWGAGADWLLKFPELQRRPFILTNVSGIHAVPISEHIFAVMLNYGRFLGNAHNAQQAHVWASFDQATESEGSFAFSRNQITELADKTMLLLGVGAIGERTAKLGQAFDMHVIGLRRNPERPSRYVDEMMGLGQLLDVVPRADFIVSSLPYTTATKHIIGRREIAAMKPTAFFVNVGRGKTVDEAALLAALQQRQIGGAALDVFEEEPLPDDAPLWQLDNLLITSHYAGITPRYHERAVAILLDNLRRYGNERPLRNVVNKAAGY